jgi:hypothetical protein
MALACFSFCYYFKNNVYKKIVSSKHVQYWITLYFIHDHIYQQSIFSDAVCTTCYRVLTFCQFLSLIK